MTKLYKQIVKESGIGKNEKGRSKKWMVAKLLAKKKARPTKKRLLHE